MQECSTPPRPTTRNSTCSRTVRRSATFNYTKPGRSWIISASEDGIYLAHVLLGLDIAARPYYCDAHSQLSSAPPRLQFRPQFRPRSTLTSKAATYTHICGYAGFFFLSYMKNNYESEKRKKYRGRVGLAARNTTFHLYTLGLIDKDNMIRYMYSCQHTCPLNMGGQVSTSIQIL